MTTSELIVQYRERTFTKEGYDKISKRLSSLYQIIHHHEEKDYPVTVKMLGFPECTLKNKEQGLGAIEELSQLLMLDITED